MVSEGRGANRRQFLVAGAGAGSAAVFASLKPWRAVIEIEGQSVPERLGALLGHAQSARSVGVRYLDGLTEPRGLGHLVALVAADVPGGEPTLRNAGDRKLRELLAHRCRQDFAEERTVTLDGWIASVTEARLCAIAALVSPR
jgi:hypothetical protein